MRQILIIICITAILFCIGLEIKNEITYKNFDIILNAIHVYQLDQIIHDSKISVDYTDMVPYETALFRFWDWVYENILPPEKYALIASYIKPYVGDKKRG